MPTPNNPRPLRAIATRLWRGTRRRGVKQAPWTLTWFLLSLSLTSIACAGSQAGRQRSLGQAHGSAVEPGWPKEQRHEIAAVQPHVEAAARQFKLDPALINGLIWVESKFEVRARSPGGNLGLMQLAPATARELAKSLGERAKPYDAGFNIRAGSLYLSRMIRKFGSPELGLAAFHGGPGHVLKWKKRGGRGVPDGSKRYVEKVLTARRRF